MFYTEYKLHPWAMCPVSHKTLEAAKEAAARGTADYPGCVCYVWDCTDSPVGTLMAIYNQGKML